MKQQQIEQTKTIAEYDGWTFHESSEYPNGYWSLEGVWAGRWQLDNMDYLTSMDWLHPVAVNVLDELCKLHDRPLNIEQSIIYRLCSRPENGEYNYLFNEVYNGIICIKKTRQNETN